MAKIKTACETCPRAPFLMVYGVIYILIGFFWAGNFSPAKEVALSWLPPLLSEDFIGLLWVAAGATALFSAVAGFTRRSGERLGFLALQFVPLLCAFFFFVAHLIFFIPAIPGGYERGGLSGLTYLAIYSGAFFMARAKAPRDISKVLEITGAVATQKARDSQ